MTVPRAERLLAVALLLAWSLGCSTEPKAEGSANCDATELSERQNCLMRRASQYGDPSLCHELGSLTEQASCVKAVAATANKPELCKSIAHPRERDECVSQLAASLSKPEACKAIENPFRRDQCLTEVAGTGDGVATACQGIDNETRRDDCYVRLAKRSKAPADVCDRVKSRKDACWAALAGRVDPALCERVGTTPTAASRRTCYGLAFTGAMSGTNDLCKNLKDASLQRECELHRVAAANDVKACEDGKLGDRTDECWAAVAPKNGDLCLRINDAGLRRFCATSYSALAKDPAICELLPLPKKQEECRKRLALEPAPRQ